MQYTCLGQRPITEDFSIQFGNCYAGWIECRVNHSRGGFHETVALHCSYAFNPFSDLIAWLEAIVRGVDEVSWVVNEEGSFARLRSVRGRNTWELNCESRTDEEPAGPWHKLMDLNVRKTDLVSRVYEAFIGFVSSPTFSEDEWGVATQYDLWRHRERFCPEAPTNFPETVRMLARWPRDGVVAGLFWAYPSFGDGRPETSPVPREWDDLELSAREHFLTELMAERVKGGQACDPRKLRSPTVETWLRQHRRP